MLINVNVLARAMYRLLGKTRVLKYLDEREKQLESELRKEFVFDALEAREVMFEVLNNPEASEASRHSRLLKKSELYIAAS